jgi:hypothetical protein
VTVGAFDVTVNGKEFVVLGVCVVSDTLTWTTLPEARRFNGTWTAMQVGIAQPDAVVWVRDVAEPPCGVQFTVELEVKPLPVSVIVKRALPALMEAGESAPRLKAG